MKNNYAFHRLRKFKLITSVLCFNILKGGIILCISAFFSMQIIGQEPVLRHSYNFNNGLADDVIGQANGIIQGSGKIINGLFVAYNQGQYIVLPADKIKINTYKSITLEAYLIAGGGNGQYTMFSYFGNTEGAFGTDYIFQSLANGGNSVSAISCKNSEAPWSVGTDVKGKMIQDAKYHHVVTTFDNHELKFYIDGVLVNTNTNERFPVNVIANFSNNLAFLCKGGYTSDNTWQGAMDVFNIYEGVMDPATIANKAEKYLEDKGKGTMKFIQTLGKVADIIPGYRPESKLSEAFIHSYKKSKFEVYPTIIRTIDTTMWSESSAIEFSELLKSEQKIKVKYNNSKIDPGELQGNAQFDFFQNDMENISLALKEMGSKADYNIVLEILFAPQNTEALYVFGIHIYILTNEGENAFSFLLNSHHNLFAIPGLYTENHEEKNLEQLKLKCTWVALEALKKQIEYAEAEITPSP